MGKSERHVRAGKARHAKLRDNLGEDGYRAFQQTAGQRGDQRLRERHGEAGYRQIKQRGYRATVQKYGRAWALRCLAQAHEANRRRRIANPTPGEQALCTALAARGYTIHAHTAEAFDYGTWRQVTAGLDYGPHDAIREAKIGSYYADILLPAAGVIIEVYGGIHQLNPTRDAQRCAWLRDQGLQVIIISEAEATDPVRLTTVLDGRGDSTAVPPPWLVRPRRRRLAA